MATTFHIKSKTGDTKDIEITLTRKGVVMAERKGILNVDTFTSAPVSSVYSLVYAGLAPKIPRLTLEQVDDAMDVFFDEGGNLQDLTSEVMEQYQELFGISGEAQPSEE